MQAVTTKFHGPTDRKGSRISATSASGIRVWIGYDHSLDRDDNHKAALLKLCRKLGWSGLYAQGNQRNGNVYVPAAVNTIYIAPEPRS